MNAPQSPFADIARVLPQRPGVVGMDDYRCTAVLVPLIQRDGESHLLFEVRAQGIKQAGEVCFPGGHFDKGVDTSFQDTALRETREELGLAGDDAARVHCLGQLDTLVSARGLLVEAYLGWLDIGSCDDLNLVGDEVASVFTLPLRWFAEHPPESYRTTVESSFWGPGEHGAAPALPIEELGLPLHYKDRTNLWFPRTLVYRSTPVIWGVTAAIIENLMSYISS